MRKTIITATILLWCILCPLAAYYYVTSTLELPDLSPGYESDWGFQLLMFTIVRFPFWVVGLLIIVAIEVLMLKRAVRGQSNEA